MRPDEDIRHSWICRNEFERARFMDLHGRLLRANNAILLILIAAIVVALPFVSDRVGVIPAAVGFALFGGIQRAATRLARPELWVFGALLGAETLIAVAVRLHGGGITPAMALLCWPAAGLAGRFPNRASRPGTGYALVLACVVVLSSDAGVLTSDPLALSLLLVAIASVHTVATVLRDSDVENRGAAILDPLTGMLNRTALINRTAEIEFQSRVAREPVAVVLLDLDRFKQINDTRGHATGDTVLQEVAYRLRKVLRAYDLVYRLGGEEFVVLLLGGTAAATAATAEQLRAAVADGPIVGIDLTVSVGVAASADGTAFVWDDVFLRADAALYRAKANGRDCVVVEDAVPGALVGSAS
ncbi:MAG: two-component system, cell cycle response regulator [Solirubrobacteraceae bacterium]|nr:two-component system, cell cycle response regulator [Solirubrobacteraceae bacterium]